MLVLLLGSILPLDWRRLVLSQIGAADLKFSPIFGLVTSDFRYPPRTSCLGFTATVGAGCPPILLLMTLPIVTLAAVQGHTGTLVDERTTNAQNGADLKIQFDTALTEGRSSKPSESID